MTPKARPSGACQLTGCPVSVTPERFFCWPHWRLVPMKLKRELATIQVRRTSAAGVALELDERTRNLVAEARAAITVEVDEGAAAATRGRAGPPA